MYDIDTIYSALTRLFDKRVPKDRVQEELDRQIWTPEVGRMIAVADSLSDLPRSNRYGLFQEMTELGEYQIATGRYKFARALTQAEIAKCY